MKLVLSIISYAALALLLLPSIFYLSGKMELESMKMLMLVATVLWYVVTPLWMEKKG